MERNFDVRTSTFRLPQGSSPQDPENLAMVARLMEAATGAKSAKVAMHQGPNGHVLTDQYNITLEFPSFVEDGAYQMYRKEGALEGEAGNLLANIIKALANGGDAKADIQKLLQVAESGGSGEEDPLGGGAGSAGKPGAPGGGAPGGGSPGGFGAKGLGESGPGAGPGAGGPPAGPGAQADPNKKKNPFASKQSKLGRAMFMEQKLRVPLKEALQIVKDVKTANFEGFVYRTAAVQAEMDVPVQDAVEIVKMVDSARNWRDFQKKASAMLLDENDRPLQDKEYAEIARIARGEATAPLV